MPPETISDPSAAIFDGVAVVGLSGPKVATTAARLKQRTSCKPFIVSARGGDGTNTFGMYVEIVQKAAMGDRIVRHTRYFVYGDTVYAASRIAGQSKANWKSRKAKDVADALLIVQAAATREGAAIYGRIMLVEMNADDISAIEGGQVPGARFRGQYRNEKDFGKYDWGKEIVTDDMPAQVIRILTDVA